GGNFLATQQAHQLYLDHRESPTRALRQLERFAGNHAFWGRSYADGKIAELRPAAEQERQQMLAERAGVLRDLADSGRDLEFRAHRARNFVAKYADVFDEDPQFRDLKQRKADMEQAVLVQRETKTADALLKRMADLEAKENVGAALDQ